MKLRILFIIATILTTLFIFNNSLQDASHSGADSDVIVDYVMEKGEQLGKDPVRFTITRTVRKSAHFLEFALQGFLLAGCFSISRRKKVALVLSLGLLTACTDEALQLFSDGRAGLISDVLIDFAGTTVGLFIFTLALKSRARKRLRSDS